MAAHWRAVKVTNIYIYIFLEIYLKESAISTIRPGLMFRLNFYSLSRFYLNPDNFDIQGDFFIQLQEKGCCKQI